MTDLAIEEVERSAGIYRADMFGLYLGRGGKTTKE
jgi:hypothetical protein